MGNLFFSFQEVLVSAAAGSSSSSGAGNPLLISLPRGSTFLHLLLCSSPPLSRFLFLSFFCASPSDFTSRQRSVLVTSRGALSISLLFVGSSQRWLHLAPG